MKFTHHFTKPWTTRPPGCCRISNFRMKWMSKKNNSKQKNDRNYMNWAQSHYFHLSVHATERSGFDWENCAHTLLQIHPHKFLLEDVECLVSQKFAQFNSSLSRSLGFWGHFHLSNDVKVWLSVFLGVEWELGSPMDQLAVACTLFNPTWTPWPFQPISRKK